jgi:hypothetical protein
VPDGLPADRRHGEQRDDDDRSAHGQAACLRSRRPPSGIEQGGNDERHAGHRQIEIAIRGRLEDRPEVGDRKERQPDKRPGEEESAVMPRAEGPRRQEAGKEDERT